MFPRPSILPRMLGFAAVALAAVVMAPVAYAHFTGYDSVDDCEIRWEDNTKYDTERIAAQDLWESLMVNNCVDLEPDTWNTIADLEWRDANVQNGWPGWWQRRIGADYIYMNSAYLDDWGLCRRKNTAMHELGHAHGFDDHTISGNVMYHANANHCSLGSHDRDDYDSLWGDS